MLKAKPLILFLDAPTVDLGDVDLTNLGQQGDLVLRNKRSGESLPPEAAAAVFAKELKTHP